ncbi:hypothetical protein HDU67_003892, partial [Dinochytrium kinnereticum]
MLSLSFISTIALVSTVVLAAPLPGAGTPKTAPTSTITTAAPTATSTPVDPCENVGFAPVCANQHTFHNMCYFEESKKTNPELANVVPIKGACNDWPVPTTKTPVDEPVDPCAEIGEASVCAGGIIFYNRCYYDEAVKANSDVPSPAVDGPCNNWPLPEPVDPCAEIGEASVCAGGIIFYNRCYYDEAVKANSDV